MLGPKIELATMGRGTMCFCINVIVQVSTASRPQHPTSNVSSLIQKNVRDSHGGARLRKECALDVIMVLDTSSSICDNKKKKKDCQNWRDQKYAAVHFAEQLAQTQSSKAGVLTFSTNAQWHAKLNTDIASVASEIRGLDYVTKGDAWPRWTNLKEALDRAREELNKNPNPDHRQLVMVFTDGEPTAGGGGKLGIDLAGHRSAAREAAKNVRESFQLSMVAIGAAAKTDFMQSLVTQPVGDNFFHVAKFQSLTKDFIEDILKEICKTPQPTPEPVVPPPPTPQATPQPPAPPTPSTQSTPEPVVPPPLTPQPTPQPPAAPTPFSLDIFAMYFKMLR